MDTVVLVLILVLGIGVLQASVWVRLLGRWRRRSRSFLVDFRTEIATSGERIIRNPEQGIYRGGTGRFSSVKGNGTMILTDRRLIFRKLTGGLIEVPIGAILAVRRSEVFLGSRVSGSTHLVVATNDPAEVGFVVTDLPAWELALAPFALG